MAKSAKRKLLDMCLKKIAYRNQKQTNGICKKLGHTAYQCSHCNFWHTTSHQLKLSKAELAKYASI